jgi:hypothetical protein
MPIRGQRQGRMRSVSRTPGIAAWRCSAECCHGGVDGVRLRGPESRAGLTERTEIEAVPFVSSILNLQLLSIHHRANASNQQKKQLQHRRCALVASEASAKLQHWHGRPESTQCGCGTEWPCEKADPAECLRHVYRRPFEPRAMEGIAARRSPAREIRRADVRDRIQRTAQPTSGI